MSTILTSKSVLGYTPQHLTLDGKPWFPMMGEIHYSRVEASDWEEELYKMKAGGIDLVSAYTIWIHHEEIENEWDFTGNRNLRGFLETVKACGMHCVLRIGPWAHGEVRNGGFPDWLMEKEKNHLLMTRTNDPAYLEEVRRFYEQIAGQARGLLLAEDGPIAMIQIENEYGHVGGRTGEEGEEHMRTLRALAEEAGLTGQIYTATGWGGAVTGGMLPVMGGYCEAPWDQRLTEIEPSGNYLFTRERNDHNIGSDHGLGVGITFDMNRFPYLTAELGGGLQVTSHRRPVATGKDTEAMTLVKLGSGCNLLGYYMYHGGTNPEGKRTTLQESRETGYPNDLPVKSYDFNAPIREYGQLGDSYRRIRRLALFIHDFGGDLTEMDYIPQPGNPEKVDDFAALRTAVRCNRKTGQGYYFVNNYVRHYQIQTFEEAELCAYDEDEHTVLADYGKQDVPAGSYYFYPFRMPIGETAVLEQAHAVPLCCLRDTDGNPDTYVFYTKDGVLPNYRIRGDLDSCRILTLREEDALRAQKLILGGREVLIISDTDFYQSQEDVRKGTMHGLLRGKTATRPSFQCYPLLPKPLEGWEVCLREGEMVVSEAVQPQSRQKGAAGNAFPGMEAFVWYECRNVLQSELRCSTEGENRRSDGQELTLSICAEGIADELGEALLCIDYEGESAQLYADGRLIADNFYTGQVWEVGLKHFAKNGGVCLTAVIHPLQENAPIYIEKHPQMENHVACRVNAVTAEAIFRISEA